MLFTSKNELLMHRPSKVISNYFLLILLCSLFLAACGGNKENETNVVEQEITTTIAADDNEITDVDIADQIQTYKKIWEASGINHYELEVQKLCFCLPDAVRLMVFEVEDNVIKSVRYADSGDEVDTGLYNQYNTVDGMFKLVEEAFQTDPAEISVAYNEKFGYIKELTIDYQENIADDEFTIIASNLRQK